MMVNVRLIPPAFAPEALPETPAFVPVSNGPAGAGGGGLVSAATRSCCSCIDAGDALVRPRLRRCDCEGVLAAAVNPGGVEVTGGAENMGGGVVAAVSVAACTESLASGAKLAPVSAESDVVAAPAAVAGGGGIATGGGAIATARGGADTAVSSASAAVSALSTRCGTAPSVAGAPVTSLCARARMVPSSCCAVCALARSAACLAASAMERAWTAAASAAAFVLASPADTTRLRSNVAARVGASPRRTMHAPCSSSASNWPSYVAGVPPAESVHTPAPARWPDRHSPAYLRAAQCVSARVQAAQDKPGKQIDLACSRARMHRRASSEHPRIVGGRSGTRRAARRTSCLLPTRTLPRPRPRRQQRTTLPRTPTHLRPPARAVAFPPQHAPLRAPPLPPA